MPEWLTDPTDPLPAVTHAARSTVTRLLDELEGGSRAAADEIFPLVYEELRSLARRHRRRWSGDETLRTTALVHEAYLKLAGGDGVAARSRAHFFAIAAQAMRQILIDSLRGRRRLKRGGDFRRISLESLERIPDGVALSDGEADALAELDDALARLAKVDVRLSRVVECRVFGAMTIADTATALGTSPATVKRDWTLACAWLYRELQPPGDP